MSVFKKRHPSVANILSEAKHNRKVLIIAIDYAKSTHKVLFINGNGDELRQPFDVHNNSEGLAYLLEAIRKTCKKRGINRKHVILGGEGVPSFARNFILSLSDKGLLVLNIHAKEAKEMRQTEQASTDKLDLIGIAKSMLHGSGKPFGPHRYDSRLEGTHNPNKICITAKPYAELFDDQEALQILTRNRGRLVQERTGCTNRIHTLIDQLFPGFLSSGCPVSPFTKASIEIMRMPQFSARHIARQKESVLAAQLKEWGTHDPDKSAANLINMAKEALSSSQQLEGCLQIVLQSHLAHYQGLVSGIATIENELHQRLTTSPASLLLSISGIGVVLAAGIYAELGASLLLHPLNELCSYAGIVPRVKQTGGPNKSAWTGKVRKGCNRILKNYLVQAAAKMRDWGPEGLKDVYENLKNNKQHADFIIAKRLLRTFKYMMVHQTIYLPPSLRGDWNEDTRESMTAYLETAKDKIAAKWNRVGQVRDAMEPTRPLGLWWQTIEAAFQNICGDEAA
jgi:transposase